VAAAPRVSSVSTPETPSQRWARLRQDIASVLRRGAWYLVRSLGPDEAVLEVDNADSCSRRRTPASAGKS